MSMLSRIVLAPTTTIALLATLLLGYTTGAFAQVTITKVLDNTTSVPGGGSFQSIGMPSFNNSGLVAFNSTINGGSTSAGVYKAQVGSVALVADDNTVPPGGGTYTSFSDPTINNNGMIAFSGVNPALGVYRQNAGTLAAVALAGTSAPGGGTFTGTSAPNAISGIGTTAFYYPLSGGAATQGIFFGSPGSLTRIVDNTTVAPGSGSGTFSGFSGVASNANGDVGFFGSITGGSFSQGLYLYTNSLSLVMNSGTAVLGGGTLTNFGSNVSLAEDGTFAFIGGITGGTASQGIFTANAGVLTTITMLGALAPGGGTFTAFEDSASINANGDVAFVAQVNGGAGGQGLFLYSSGTLQRVLFNGSLLEGLSIGGYVLGPTSLNDNGQIAFRYVNQSSRQGIAIASINTNAPEPTTLILVVLGMVSCGFVARRRLLYTL